MHFKILPYDSMLFSQQTVDVVLMFLGFTSSVLLKLKKIEVSGIDVNGPHLHFIEL